MFISEKRVRCKDCGFLGLKTRDDETLEETWIGPAEPQQREPDILNEGIPRYRCRRGVLIEDEVPEEEGDYAPEPPEPFVTENAWVEVLRKPRHCRYFEQYERGADFEWHLDRHSRRRDTQHNERMQWALLLWALSSVPSSAISLGSPAYGRRALCFTDQTRAIRES